MITSAQEVLLFGEYVQVTVGEDMKKNISYPSFLSILSKALRETATSTMTAFRLPKHCFYIATSAMELNVSCYYPEAICDLIYGGNTFKVATPNIIISHTLRKGTQGSLEVWKINQAESVYLCTNKPLSYFGKTFENSRDYSRGIWVLPFSNVYSCGKMCFGNNSMPAVVSVNDLSVLDWYYDFLWKSPFNNDLGVYEATLSVERWYNKLASVAKNGGSFPYELLKNYKNAEEAPAEAPADVEEPF